MKKLILSTVALAALCASASAADLPRRAVAPVAPIVAVPVFTWTGFYVGVQAGYAFGQDKTTLFVGGVPLNLGAIGVDTSYDTDGFVGGVHAGYNVQFGAFVAGVEGDLEYANVKGSRTLADALLAPGYSATASTEIGFQGSLRARLGFALDRAMIYATGGLAFANVEHNYGVTLPAGNVFGVPAGSYSERADETRWGYTLGAGVEYAFTSNLTARIEYRYTNLDSYNNVSTFLSPGDHARQEPDFHAVRAGVSYKF